MPGRNSQGVFCLPGWLLKRQCPGLALRNWQLQRPFSVWVLKLELRQGVGFLGEANRSRAILSLAGMYYRAVRSAVGIVVVSLVF